MTRVFHAPLERCASWRAPVVWAALLFPSLLYAQSVPTRLSFDAALQAATTNSASIQAAQASIRASEQAAVKAAQLPDPMLKVGIDNVPINGPQRFTAGQDSMTMRRIGIEQEWVSGEKRQLRAAWANELVGREHASSLMQLANVREQTAMAWLNAHYAQAKLALQQALLDHMQHELAATTASYRGAKASAMDVVQAQALLAQAQDQTLKAEQLYQASLIDLSRWSVTPVSEVIGEPPALVSSVPSLSLDDLRRLQPTLIAADGDIAVADAGVAVAKSNRNPNWTWGVTYQQRGGAYSNMVSVGVSIPLTFNHRDNQDRDTAERAELGTKARLTYRDELQQIQADIRNQGLLLESGRERIANLNQSLVPAAKRRVELTDAAYRAATGSLADTFAARRAQLDAQLQVLDLERETAQIWARLEYQVVPASMATDR